MDRSILFFVASLPLVAGCAAPASDVGATASEAAYSSTTWIKIADCEGGAVVDVDEDERRELQLVVRNHEAAEYILAHGSDYMRGMQLNAKGELILRGSTDRGVFSPGDFHAFRGYGNQQWPIYDVFAVSGGVKVSLLGNDQDEAANWWFPNCH